MRKITFALVAVFLLLAVVAALAQDKSVNIGRVYVTVPKPGMTKQLEEGRKRHMEFHRKQNDSWTWTVYEVETGEDTGSYLSISFGHSWKDFDAWDQKMGAADTADGAINLTPFAAQTRGSIWMYMSEVSRPPSDTNPSKMVEVIHFMLNSGGDSDFEYAVGKITEAINKTNWPAHYFWYSLVNGGQTPHYVLVIPHDSWADMADLDPSFPVMLEKGLGRHEARELISDLDKSTRSEWSEVLVYRPDLSYIPGK